MSLIPTTIITGFLGSGKTTLLKRVLTEAHGQKIAVIENEFGEENIDNEILVADTTETIIQMSNGCICCNIRDDLRFTLNDLATRRRTGELDFERVLIETTGLADPGPVAQTFFMNTEIAEQYVLDAIVTLVDGKHAAEQFNQRQEARRQVGFADQIFISKSDLVGPEELLALMRRLSHMNPRAPMRRADFGRVPIEAVLDLRGFNLDAKLDIYPDYVKAGGAGDDHHHHEGGHCEDPSRHIDGLPHHHHYDDDVKSFVYRAERPFISGRAEDFLGAVVQVFGPRMLRYKGVLCIEGADRKVVFQGVHQLMGSDVGPAWAEGEPRVSKIVFIGIDLPRDILVQGLDQCLV